MSRNHQYVASGTTLCHNFNSRTGCRHGNACKFTHEWYPNSRWRGKKTGTDASAGPKAKWQDNPQHRESGKGGTKGNASSSGNGIDGDVNQEDAAENVRLVQEMLQNREQCAYAHVLKQRPTAFYSEEDFIKDVLKKSTDVEMQELRGLIKAGDAKREADERKGAKGNVLYGDIPGTKELRQKIPKYLDA